MIEAYRKMRVKIRRGIRHLHKIIFKEGGIRSPGKKPGDVIIIIHEIKHPVYNRRGNDLFLRMQLSKKQIKHGCQRQLITLDGRKLNLTILPDDEGDTNTIIGEGMPIAKNNKMNGQLIVEYDIGKFFEIYRFVKSSLLRGDDQIK